MWAYLFSKPRTESKSEEVELEHAGQEFSKPTLDNPMAWALREPLFIHLGKKRVWVLVKADLNDEQASILSDNDRLLTGTVKLIWWEPIMSADFERTIARNDAEMERTTRVFDQFDALAALAKKAESVGKESALESLIKKAKNLPDGPDKTEF